MLTDLGHLRTDYSSDVDDIARDFYNPCLSEGIRYDRITGFFSSTVFHITWNALETFVLHNGGQLRLLCSPRLAERDADGILYGYKARGDDELARRLHSELEAMLSDPSIGDSARLLAALVATGALDIRLARVADQASSPTLRMFHDKMGLFIDDAGNVVGFRGSMNESYLGLSSRGNIESIDVWPSWEGGRDAERARNAAARFERLWAGEVRGVTVLELPTATREELERVANDVDLEAALAHLKHESESRLGHVAVPVVGGMSLREHQREAVARWQANRMRGLLAHATGAGKTVTGLYCTQLAVDRQLVPVVLVPSQLLLDQWAQQIRELLGYRVIRCGGGHDRWAREGLVRAALEHSARRQHYAVVAILNSAASADFIAQVRPLSHRVALIADEVHRMGSPEFRAILDRVDAKARLGLSATPERAYDPEGTAAIWGYFGGIIHRFTLKDALDAGVLAPYVYEPHWVSLTADEQRRWDELTHRIRRHYAMIRRSTPTTDQSGRLRILLIERARIVKNADSKTSKAAELVSAHYNPDSRQKWLIYCDNQAQVDTVRAALDRRGISSWEYHTQMRGSPGTTLRLFELHGGIIVAIKCLDEGVDIPSATHALILASSRNPREYIQRRGRVLRRAPGKTLATLLDVLVLPETTDADDPSLPLVFGELARALQFAEWAVGESGATQIEHRWIDLGLPLEQLDAIRAAGIEVDDEEE